MTVGYTELIGTFLISVCSFGCDRGHDGIIHPGGGGGREGSGGAAASGRWGSAREGAPGPGGGAGALGQLHHTGAPGTHPPPCTGTSEHAQAYKETISDQSAYS